MSKQAGNCPTWESRKKIGFLVGESDFQTQSSFWVQLLEALSLQRRQDLSHGAKLDQQQRGRLWPKKKKSHREDTRRNVSAKEAPQSGSAMKLTNSLLQKTNAVWIYQFMVETVLASKGRKEKNGIHWTWMGAKHRFFFFLNIFSF